MSETSQPDGDALPPTLAWRIDDACNQFERAWRGPSRPRIEDFLLGWEEPERSALLRVLILLKAIRKESLEIRPLCRSFSDI